MKKFLLISIFFVLLFLVLPRGFAMAAPVIFFSDLTSGPKTGGQGNKGVFVTIKGKNFGSTRDSSYVSIGGGQADNYPVWSDAKIVFQLGANATTGDITVTTSAGISNGIAFTVRSGNIYFIATTGSNSSNGSYESPWLTHNYARGKMVAGDTLYYRAGTYIAVEDYGVIGFRTAHSGTAGNPRAVLTYPGETVTLDPSGGERGINFYGDTGRINYITIGGFVIDTTIPINAASVNNLRIVNCDIRNGDKYGAILCEYGNDNLVIYGNRVYNSCTGGYKLYHAIYVANASNGIDIQWNEIDTVGTGSNGGRGIQIHEDTGQVFKNITIANNIIHNVARDGILLSTNCQDANIYNNILYDTGLVEYAGIRINTAAVSPNIKIYNNTIYHCGRATEGAIYIQNAKDESITVKNNIIYQLSGDPYWTFGVGTNTVIASNNCYYGNGNGPTWDTNRVNSDPVFWDTASHDFHLQETSPAKEAGTSTVSSVLDQDYDGISRPQGAGYDIGAYEYISQSLHPADLNQNNRIEMKELIAYIGLWKINPTSPALSEVLEILGRWLSGT